MTQLLEVQNVTARYGELMALNDLSLSINEGETLAFVGANGAGKTTLMRLLCGLMKARAGTIKVAGSVLKPGDPRAAAAKGLALVPEGRLLFDSLTIEENLRIGMNDRPGAWSLDAIYQLFPVLREKRKQLPGMLSGGQQQMAAIGRALASNPRILLCDEISLGLSPAVTEEVYVALRKVKAEGTSLVVIDQDVARATKIADSVACLFKGRITYNGPVAEAQPEELKKAYFGVNA